MKKKHWSILAFLLTIITLIYFRFNTPSCEEVYELALKMKFRGIVLDKYRNENQHNYKTIVLHENNIERSLTWESDISGFYYYIQVNDSIVKNNDTYKIDVYRNSELDTTFLIDYGCK